MGYGLLEAAWVIYKFTNLICPEKLTVCEEAYGLDIKGWCIFPKPRPWAGAYKVDPILREIDTVRVPFYCPDRLGRAVVAVHPASCVIGVDFAISDRLLIVPRIFWYKYDKDEFTTR